MRNRALLGLTLAVLSAVPAAFAASFNCAKARSVQEKLVCSDPELSKLDEQMAREYRKALPGPHEPAVRDRQEQWLRTERDSCTTRECVRTAYLDRLAELRGTPTSNAPAPSSVASRPTGAPTPSLPPQQSAQIHGATPIRGIAPVAQSEPAMPVPVVNIGNGALPADVASAVRQYIAAHTAVCQGKIFVLDQPAPFLIAEPKLALIFNFPLDAGDKLNHVEWRGRVALYGSAIKYFTNEKWGDWVAVDVVRDRVNHLYSPDIRADIVAVKRDGRWALEGLGPGAPTCPPGAA